MYKYYFKIFFFFSVFYSNQYNSQSFSVNLSPQIDTICELESLSFSANVQNCPSISLVSWLINGFVVNSGNNLVFDTTGFQQGDLLEVQVTCQYGFDSTIVISASTMPIAVNSFVLDAGVDLYIDSGTTIQFQSSSTADSLVWSPSFLVSNTSIIQPTTSPNVTTTYQLKGIKSTCEKIDYVTVFVKGSFKIPNTFSPNGDGKNDNWLIQNIADFPANDMLIMNRFGQELYQSRPYTFANAWTGVFNGQPLPEGVYFYILNLGGDLGVKKGTISIIR
jgi:gliding motility-associated-like protein